MFRISIISIVVCLGLLFSSCEKNEPEICDVTPISSTDALCKVEGFEYTYSDGIAIAGQPDNVCDRDDVLKIFLSSGVIEGDKCLNSYKDYSVTVLVERKIGVYDVSLCNQVGFMHNYSDGSVKGSHSTDCGLIEIVELTDSTVKGKISCYKDSNNSINGEFELSICDWSN